MLIKVLFCSIAVAVSAGRSLSQDVEQTIRQIGSGQIQVRISQPEPYSLRAAVRISYQITNGGNVAAGSQRFFPVSGPPVIGKEWCRISVDGKPVDFETEPLVASPRDLFAVPSILNAAEWKQRIEAWIRQDARLNELAARARQLIDHQEEVRAANDEFYKLIKEKLIHEEHANNALNVANGHDNIAYLVRLMPEIDASLRIDEPFQRWKYISLLDEHSPGSYQPYEDEWRAKANQWLTSTPALRELVPRLRETWKSIRDGHELLNGPILKHLHDVNGLSLPVALHFKLYLENRSHPSAAGTLAPLLFTDLRKIVDARKRDKERRLTEWGFDQNIVSMFTGRLLNDSRELVLGWPGQWRDSSVLKMLGRPQPTDASDRRRGGFVPMPMLFKFSAPLDSGRNAVVVVAYDVPLQPRNSPNSSGLSVAMPDLAVVFPGKQKVPVTVIAPKNTHFVIAPAPVSVDTLQGGERRFKTVLEGDGSSLHLAPSVPAGVHMSDIQYDDRTQADLETLIRKTNNLTVRPLQMSTLFGILLRRKDFRKAHEISQRIKAEHPDFKDYFEASIRSNHAAREAAKQAEWIDQKGKSPILETDEDIRRFDPFSHQPLKLDALQALAQKASGLDVSKLNAKEQLGRQFMLCQAGDNEEDLAALVRHAKQHPAEMRYSLKLIEHLTIEKSAALPFVISQIDPNFRSKQEKTDEMVWKQNAACSAPRSFRTRQTADQIIRFMNTTTDSLLIQAAMDALSGTTLPEQFDELASLADRVFGSSESAYMQYLDLLLRSDRNKAIPLMADLKERHPKMSHRIMRALGRAGHRMALREAATIYHESQDIKGELQSAVSALRDLAESNDIAALTYRSGLEPWMNESLVSVIRMKGGDESVFPFVEAFYKEFVAGKQKHNHLTCVAAFERIGDPRALVYLKEILKNTERKRDAATAIGNLMLDRRIIHSRISNPLDEHIHTVQLPDSSPDAGGDAMARAWGVLLKDPQASFRRMIHTSPLRDVIEDARSGQFETFANRVPYVARFGPVAASELLSVSDGCSLEKRYMLAHLLKLVLPESRDLIQAAADNQTGDSDRRLTARLALALANE